MTIENMRWELEMKADRILCRLTGEQIAYLGDGFPWAVTAADLQNAYLVDPVRKAALRLGREAALIAERDGDGAARGQCDLKRVREAASGMGWLLTRCRACPVARGGDGPLGK